MKKLNLLFILVVFCLVPLPIKAAGAPFNTANFPPYKTNPEDNVFYCFGPQGTEYYGFLGSTDSKIWELHSKDLLVPEGQWSLVNWYDGEDGTPILNRGESLYLTNLFDTPTRSCMITKAVSTSGAEAYRLYSNYDELRSHNWDESDGVGYKEAAHTWVPSLGEYIENEHVYKYLDDSYQDSYCSAWTRSYAARSTVGGGWHAYTIGNQTRSAAGYGTFEVRQPNLRVHLAFRLDLNKVLGCKYTNGGGRMYTQ